MPIDFKAIGERIKVDRGRLCVVICGSRDWPDPQAVYDYVDTLPATTKVIAGGARGVDTWAEQAAIKFGLEVDVMPADWDHYGKSAGFRRNQRMILHLAAWPGEKRLIAFWDGQSRGTKHSIDYAKDMGLPVQIVFH